MLILLCVIDIDIIVLCCVENDCFVRGLYVSFFVLNIHIIVSCAYVTMYCCVLFLGIPALIRGCADRQSNHHLRGPNRGSLYYNDAFELVDTPGK